MNTVSYTTGIATLLQIVVSALFLSDEIPPNDRKEVALLISIPILFI